MGNHLPETKKRLQSEYRERNREKLRAYQKERRLKLKLTVLEHYGNECAECGFNDYRALHIDHVNDNGAEERKSLGGQNFAGWQFYDWLIKQGLPEGYQTLCANHNSIKQWIKNNPV